MKAGAEFYAALFALHERMLAGDPTLLGDVARLVMQPLTAQLRQEFGTVDDQLIADGLADALMEYGKNPSAANATAGPGAMGFLVMRSKSRVVDAMRKGRRRDIAEAGYAHDLNPSTERARGNVVELRRVPAEHDTEDTSASVSVPPPDVEGRLDREARVAEVLAGAKSDVDRRLLEMMLEGIRDTADYARVLGIETEPVEVQEVIVKRHKDRLLAAAKRREEAKQTPPKRRGRPRRRGRDGGNRG
jgi:hypothetical protein